jgi:hypothetical protein
MRSKEPHMVAAPQFAAISSFLHYNNQLTETHYVWTMTYGLYLTNVESQRVSSDQRLKVTRNSPAS